MAWVISHILVLGLVSSYFITIMPSKVIMSSSIATNACIRGVAISIIALYLCRYMLLNRLVMILLNRLLGSSDISWYLCGSRCRHRLL